MNSNSLKQGHMLPELLVYIMFFQLQLKGMSNFDSQKKVKVSLLYTAAVQTCEQGEVRLVNGTDSAGRVEICLPHNGAPWYGEQCVTKVGTIMKLEWCVVS